MDQESEEAESSKSLSKKPNSSSHYHGHVEVETSENQEQTCCEQVEKVPALKSIPKRKLSVFYRSFDVITPTNPSSQGSKSVLQVKRSSSSPIVGGDEEDDTQKPINQSCESYVKARSQEPKRNPPIEHQSGRTSPPKVKKLVRVDESMKFEGYDYQKILSKFTGGKPSSDVNIRCQRGSQSMSDQKDTSTSVAQRHIVSVVPPSKLKRDPAEIKDPGGPAAGTAAAAAAAAVAVAVAVKETRFDRNSARFDSGVEKALAREMSSRENSSCGSESEGEMLAAPLEDEIALKEIVPSIQKRSITESGRERRHLSDTEQAIEKTNYLHQCLISSHRNGLHVVNKVACRTTNSEDGAKLINAKHRKGGRTVERSLSEGDNRCWCKCSCSCKCKGNCKCLAKRSFPQEVDDSVQAFPSLNDKRLRKSGFTNLLDGEDWSPYRENLAEGELERKYTAFSIGLGTDRITLKRRMTLSLRQRDLSERNFTTEIQRMQQDIQDLSVLCTDRDTIEKVERARHRLEMVARCSHRVSCAAETLGAVHQEHRISKAVLIADKFLQLLRTRCENLGVEVAVLKRILVKNNIPIDETTGELGDELPRIRYRGGLPTNNRTMMARRRASIATISRPLITPADAAKDAPKQRNSVSGRVTLRRPSLCFESPKWEVERLHFTESVTTAELRGISEQIESRRASLEEKEASSRNDRRTSVLTAIASVENVLVEGCNIEELNHQSGIDKKSNWEVENPGCRIQEEPSSPCDLWLHVDQPLRSKCTLEKRRKTSSLRARTTERCLRLSGKQLEWQSILWSLFIFFLGFYVKHLTSTEIDSDATLWKR